MTEPLFLDAGDTALVVEFGTTIEREHAVAVMALADRLRALRPVGVIDLMPSFRSLMVHYDPCVTSGAELQAVIRPCLKRREDEATPPRRVWRLPVCYEADCAPDRASVAERCNLTPAQVIEAHAAETYRVYMIGFLPGFPYMGDLVEALHLPRLETPRVNLPAGSVAIANQLTAIYPLASPGGWHLIGRSPVRLFDATSDRPALLAPGDAVRFEPVDRITLAEIENRVRDGCYQPLQDRLEAPS
ncbi:MAG: 5-oxoprolinase subunit PxpB [Rhodospirillales bacterium]